MAQKSAIFTESLPGLQNTLSVKMLKPVNEEKPFVSSSQRTAFLSV